MTIRELFRMAERKGLKVQKNVFTSGYTVVLPGGNHYVAPDMKDLRSYVQGY